MLTGTTQMLKIGLVREEKIPNDNRVTFSPGQCAELKTAFPQFNLIVQPSPRRCFYGCRIQATRHRSKRRPIRLRFAYGY